VIFIDPDFAHAGGAGPVPFWRLLLHDQ
jgi:hypothetical protein